MPIDLRMVEPLGSKSVLLEQALRRHQNNSDMDDVKSEIDMSDMVTPDYQWLNEDKQAIKNLVAQIDASIGQLAQQTRELQDKADYSRAKVEKEQQLLFKQIRTLNTLLKNQVTLFSAMERQVSDIEIRQNQFIPQVGIGLIAGLMSAITILVTAPWLTVLIEHLRG